MFLVVPSVVGFESEDGKLTEIFYHFMSPDGCAGMNIPYFLRKCEWFILLLLLLAVPVTSAVDMASMGKQNYLFVMVVPFG